MRSRARSIVFDVDACKLKHVYAYSRAALRFVEKVGNPNRGTAPARKPAIVPSLLASMAIGVLSNSATDRSGNVCFKCLEPLSFSTATSPRVVSCAMVDFSAACEVNIVATWTVGCCRSCRTNGVGKFDLVASVSREVTWDPLKGGPQPCAECVYGLPRLTPRLINTHVCECVTVCVPITLKPAKSILNSIGYCCNLT